MREIVAVVGSVTSASRLKKALEKKGCINSEISHTPSAISAGGCSYSVYLSENCIPVLSKTVDEYKIALKGIYKKYIKEGKEFYYDLSG